MVEITDIVKTHRPQIKMYPGQPYGPGDLVVASEAVEKLINEGGAGFYNYVDSCGLSMDSSLIVLSSKHHYYYDSEEMNKAKTVVYLKELNQIREIKTLLQSHIHFLPSGCNFVGCFVNNKKVERFAVREETTELKKESNSDNLELGIISRFPFLNMLYSFMDSKTDAYMSEESVIQMLDYHGFKVINMKEINGITYFHSRKVPKTFN
jgi:hypothetical protein